MPLLKDSREYKLALCCMLYIAKEGSSDTGNVHGRHGLGGLLAILLGWPWLVFLCFNLPFTASCAHAA